MTRTTLLALLGATVVATGIGVWLRSPPPPPPPTIRTALDAQAPQRRVVALGRIEPQGELLRLAAPAGQDTGRVVELRAEEGQWVAKGDVVAVLDTLPRLQASLAQAEATLAQRRAALAKTVADLDSQAKTLAAAMEQQEAQRDRAKWEFERLQQLQRSGIYRDTALIDRKLALDGAEHAVASARLALERTQAVGSDGVRVDEAGARADMAAAEAALARARADLAFGTIRSPGDGRVIRRIARIGEQVGQDGVVEIGDTRVMQVRAEVFESDVRLIAPGARATVGSRALSGVLTGTVTHVGLKVRRQSIIGEDPAAALDARVIEVLVRLDGPSSRLAEGLTGLQVRTSFEAETAAAPPASPPAQDQVSRFAP